MEPVKSEVVLKIPKADSLIKEKVPCSNPSMNSSFFIPLIGS